VKDCYFDIKDINSDILEKLISFDYKNIRVIVINAASFERLQPTLSWRPRPVIARNEAIHCGLGKGTWIATALRASQ
jgi:hypothetical protein